jgi:hypothetical protein
MKILLIIFLVGCGSGNKSSGTSTTITYSCEVPRKSYSGCCSSHDGFEDNCDGKGDVKFASTGELVCKDWDFVPKL